MNRLAASIFLPIGLLVLALPAWLGWLILSGASVSMHPLFALMLIFMGTAGFTTVIWCAVALLRGRSSDA